ncbi:MAG: spore cortex biosynthesis protein YabQ [Firmicutes bacterium]|nr:spore cortex biosynthesis protein YabQ [Bacillota bacterium]
MFAAQGQAQAFLATVYAGLAAGVAYDLLRLLRLSTRAGQVLTNLLDFVFWILTAMLVALAAALSGAQGLRFYLVLGTACGMLLWAAGLRRIMLGTARFASNAVQKALRIPPKEGRENRKQAGKKAEKGE